MITKNERLAVEQFQDWTSSTAIYPKEHSVSYLVLGLIAEFAEFANAPTREDEVKEVGDVFWFLSETANLLGVRLTDLYDAYYSASRYKNPEAIIHDIWRTCGVVAKHLRDGSSYSEQLTDLMGWLTVGAVAYIRLLPVTPTRDLNLAYVLNITQRKLSSRKERGTLGGSGDDR